MKKYFKSHILLIVFIFMLSNITFVHAQTGNSERKIQDTIKTYFSAQLDSLKDGNEKSFLKIKNNISLSDSGKTLYNYELGKLKYLLASYALSTNKVNDYNLNISFDNINIKDKNATISANVDYTISDSWGIGVQPRKIYHEITLSQNNGNWRIEDDKYSDELKELYPVGTDFDDVISKLSTSTSDINNKNITSTNQSANLVEPPIQYIVPGDYYAYYDRTKAVNYALSWTSEGTGTSGTSYNNGQFKYFSSGNDCQNYVSQSIWAGFGGTSSSPTAYPMNSIDWWANTSNTSYSQDYGGVYRWNWVNTGDFFTYITNNYSNNYYYGPQGYSTTSTSSIQVGDYVYVPGHVLFVTRIDDNNGNGTTEYNEIYISAHTNNHKNYNLASLYGSTQPSNMQFVKVLRIRCNDGSY